MIDRQGLFERWETREIQQGDGQVTQGNHEAADAAPPRRIGSGSKADRPIPRTGRRIMSLALPFDGAGSESKGTGKPNVL